MENHLLIALVCVVIFVVQIYEGTVDRILIFGDCFLSNKLLAELAPELKKF